MPDLHEATEPLDLEHLRALDAAATDAPWTAGGPYMHEHEGRANAALIAAARNALPALLDRLAHAERELGRLRAEVATSSLPALAALSAQLRAELPPEVLGEHVDQVMAEGWERTADQMDQQAAAHAAIERRHVEAWGRPPDTGGRQLLRQYADAVLAALSAPVSAGTGEPVAGISPRRLAELAERLEEPSAVAAAECHSGVRWALAAAAELLAEVRHLRASRDAVLADLARLRSPTVGGQIPVSYAVHLEGQ